MSGDLNAGYVGTLLEQYLENPEAVDPAWRQLFEGADNGILSALPGLSRLIEMRSEEGNGDVPAGAALPVPLEPVPEAGAPEASLAPSLSLIHI